MNDKEFTEKCHSLIHSLRLIPGYKASEAEKKLSNYVIERFKDECDECKQMGEKKAQQPQAKKGFFGKLGDLADK